MTQYDICIFVETKLTDLDILSLPDGYLYEMKNRKKYKRASGGIIIIYKTYLQNDIKFHITESQFVLWFTISKKLLNANSDILFGCVYVPPENSVYSSKEAFEELENEMINLLKSKNRFISLIGDFNAKTSALPDFVIPDESVVDLFNLDTDCDIIDFLYDYVKLPQQGISLDRVTKCSCRPNNYGHKLLDLCKKNNLYIANSRIGWTRQKHRCTNM